mmetsp:Transcript_28345/g.75700  ORF Transcript_28345/g.75700 Transcript_28345/m.75700 type:complete len:336 (+) Transcript_28345:376-1383(+)
MDEAPVELRRWHVPLEVLRSGGRARVGGSREVHGPPLVGVPPDLEGGVVLPEEGCAEDPQRSVGRLRPRLHDHEVAAAPWLLVARDIELTEADEALEVLRHVGSGFGHLRDVGVGRQDDIVVAELQLYRRQVMQLAAIKSWLERDLDEFVDRGARHGQERRATVQERPAPMPAAERHALERLEHGGWIVREPGRAQPDAPRVVPHHLHALEVPGPDLRRGVAPDQVAVRAGPLAEAYREHARPEIIHHRGLRLHRQRHPPLLLQCLQEVAGHGQPGSGVVGGVAHGRLQQLLGVQDGRLWRADPDDGLERRVLQHRHFGARDLPERLQPGRVRPD